MSRTGQAKVCASCGADVSTAERMKDAKGRYICIPCVDKLRARKRAEAGGVAAGAAAAAPSSDQGADLRHFMTQAKQAAQNQCPSCGAFAQPGAVICVNCGYDARSQAQIQTKFGTARAAKGGGGSGSGSLLDNSAFATVVGLIWFGIGTALPLWLSFGAQEREAAIFAALPSTIAGFVLWVLWIISYFRRSNSVGVSVLVLLVTLVFNVIGRLIACAWFNKEGPNLVTRYLAAAVAFGVFVGVVVNVHYLFMLEWDSVEFSGEMVPPAR